MKDVQKTFKRFSTKRQRLFKVHLGDPWTTKVFERNTGSTVKLESKDIVKKYCTSGKVAN